MAPMHLFLLLEIHCSPAKESCPYLMHFLTKKTLVKPLKELEDWGLIEVAPMPKGDYEPHGWATTDKAKAYIEALLATPLPVQTWTVHSEFGADERSLFDRVFGRSMRW